MVKVILIIFYPEIYLFYESVYALQTRVLRSFLQILIHVKAIVGWWNTINLHLWMSVCSSRWRTFVSHSLRIESSYRFVFCRPCGSAPNQIWFHRVQLNSFFGMRKSFAPIYCTQSKTIPSSTFDILAFTLIMPGKDPPSHRVS